MYVTWLSCRQTPLTPYSPYPGGRAHALGEEGEGVVSALGMKRLRETPPDERLRNAKRAVKRLRHEARCVSCCYTTSFWSGGWSDQGWASWQGPILLATRTAPSALGGLSVRRPGVLLVRRSAVLGENHSFGQCAVVVAAILDAKQG